MVSEIVSLFVGPVYLMNEYQSVYGSTKVNGRYVDNCDYLSVPKKYSDVDRSVFLRKNDLEYKHQDMSRGQIDHINYIFNPVNEYFSGKPVKDIYFQYGFGNTLLLGGTMRFFCGLSIENYYKCYIFYLIYAVLCLFLLWFIFKEALYVAAAFFAYVLSFYWSGFIGFILAPGIIPTIHCFDIAVIFSIFLYFRYKNIWAAALSLFLSFLAVIFNVKLGGILSMALLITGGFYLKDKLSGRRRIFALTIWGILLGTLIFGAFKLLPHTADPFFKYFLLGYMSNSPGKMVVFFTIVYLLISYLFLFFLRKERSEFKYLYVFLFFYNQGLLIYFFWSGLLSHLVFSVQFIGWQIVVMLFMMKDKYSFSRHIVRIIAVMFFIFAAFALRSFYFAPHSGKKYFLDNFKDHKTYAWGFERAHVVSTIDPALIDQSLALINNYSRQPDTGIYILSKYDNLLPFLSGHYSAMRYFSLSGYLLNEEALLRVVADLRRAKIEYLYVDRDILDDAVDLWQDIFSKHEYTDFLARERKARLGRSALLRNIFYMINEEYVKVDEGGLLAVYKKKI